MYYFLNVFGIWVRDDIMIYFKELWCLIDDKINFFLSKLCILNVVYWSYNVLNIEGCFYVLLIE